MTPRVNALLAYFKAVADDPSVCGTGSASDLLAAFGRCLEEDFRVAAGVVTRTAGSVLQRRMDGMARALATGVEVVAGSAIDGAFRAAGDFVEDLIGGRRFRGR